MQLASKAEVIDACQGNPMSLVEQVRRVGVAEIKLIVEIDSARHQVLREGVRPLQAQASAKAPLPFHKERVVIVEPRRDESIDLPKVRVDSAFPQQPRVERRQNHGASVTVGYRVGGSPRTE